MFTVNRGDSRSACQKLSHRHLSKENQCFAARAGRLRGAPAADRVSVFPNCILGSEIRSHFRCYSNRQVSQNTSEARSPCSAASSRDKIWPLGAHNVHVNAIISLKLSVRLVMFFIVAISSQKSCCSQSYTAQCTQRLKKKKNHKALDF